jgi:hypothetical protein
MMGGGIGSAVTTIASTSVKEQQRRGRAFLLRAGRRLLARRLLPLVGPSSGPRGAEPRRGRGALLGRGSPPLRRAARRLPLDAAGAGPRQPTADGV